MLVQRALLGIATLLLCAAGLAATVAERSPFTQGLWWEPARSGSGFEMFNAGGQVMVIWYTFDENSRPTWYTAQGTQSSLGTEAWPLMKHRWVNGVKMEPRTVGSLRLVPAHADASQVEWVIGSRGGTTRIEPFVLSGVTNEVDRSGTWFDPANSGWGLTLLEQGELSGAALFTYDITGEPMWAAGFERGKGNVELFVSSGACPWCAYRAPTSTSAGRLWFDFRGESELTLRDRTAIAMAPGIGAEGARMTQLGRPASTRPADRGLARFDAESLRRFLVKGMANVPSSNAGGDFSAALPPASPPMSTTNLQEAGVDEAALVQSNGSYIYTYAHGATYNQGSFSYVTTRGPRIASLRIARVEAAGAVVKPAGEVDIGTGSRTPMASAGLYLHGTNLVSVHGTHPYSYYSWNWNSGSAWSTGLTQVEILDISSPERPASKWRADIDGHVVASRRVGSKLYIVSRFTPYLSGYTFAPWNAAQVAANEQILASVGVEALLPKIYTTDTGRTSLLLEPAQIYIPPQGARSAVADLVAITSIDIETRRVVQSLGIAGSVETIYASPTNLFVASTRWDLRTSSGFFLPEPSMVRTDLHQIRLGSDAMSIVGSASVEGYLAGNINAAPFRLSEHQGRLRVVTTSASGMWGAEHKNRLTILEPSAATPGLLKTVSYLPNAERPQPIGKPGEQLHATRFLGDRLYAVTFKNVDPLYVIDLADSADPRITGALEIPGFSDYLHPLPFGMLLGFGKDAAPAADFGDGQFAWYQGLQVALYDVNDAGKPVEKQRLLIGRRGSQSALLEHHHAFSSLQMGFDRRRMAIPASVNDGTAQGTGPSTNYPWQYSGLLRFEMRGTSAANATLVPLEPLVTARSGGSPWEYRGYDDPGIRGGRSVLFPSGTVYVGNGAFWHQDEAGTVTGPF